MKSITTIFLIASLLSVSIAQARPPSVKKVGDGWYRQNHDKTNIYYLADSKTKLCFAKASDSGLVDISCSTLKRRDEWKEVLDW